MHLRDAREIGAVISTDVDITAAAILLKQNILKVTMGEAAARITHLTPHIVLCSLRYIILKRIHYRIHSVYLLIEMLKRFVR